MPTSFVTVLRRLLVVILVLVALLLLLSIPALLAPVAAQTPAPTPTPSDAELLGVESLLDRGRQLVERFGWLGAILALILGGIIFLLSGYGEGMREAWKEHGKQAGDKPFRALDQHEARRTETREHKSGVAIYLEWLRNEESLCYLPIIPIEKRQDQLLLEEVYVPLRVVEREQIEGFRKLTLGEFDPEGEYRLRKEALEALKRSRRVYRSNERARDGDRWYVGGGDFPAGRGGLWRGGARRERLGVVQHTLSKLPVAGGS